MPRQCEFPVLYSCNRDCYRSGPSPGVILVIALIALLSGYACLCEASSDPDRLPVWEPVSSAFSDAPRASDDVLDRMRGGFIVSWNGQDFVLPFSIDGIERLTQINGQTYLNGELMTAAFNSRALIPFTQTGPVSVSVQSAVPVNVPARVSEPVVQPMAPLLAQTAGGPGAASGEAGNAGAGGATSPVATSDVPPPTQTAQVTTNGSLILIQNGPGNSVALPANLPPDALATFIQNSVNNQVIRNITTLNITLNAQMLAVQARLNVLNQSLNNLR
ncbi:MAG TPA: hypothetical protein PLE48_00335 [Thiobacillus sp.]|nr:hypothetical protein [Thiobacillus sp.]